LPAYARQTEVVGNGITKRAGSVVGTETGAMIAAKSIAATGLDLTSLHRTNSVVFE